MWSNVRSLSHDALSKQLPVARRLTCVDVGKLRNSLWSPPRLKNRVPVVLASPAPTQANLFGQSRCFGSASWQNEFSAQGPDCPLDVLILSAERIRWGIQL